MIVDVREIKQIKNTTHSTPEFFALVRGRKVKRENTRGGTNIGTHLFLSGALGSIGWFRGFMAHEGRDGCPSLLGSDQPSHCTIFSIYPQLSTMEVKSQQPKDQKSVISLLIAAIEAVNLAKEVSSVTPAKAVFGTVSVLLTMLKVRFLVCVGLLRAHAHPGRDG